MELELYNDKIHPYLIPHNDLSLNYGNGYVIKEGTPPETIKLIREYHDEKLKKGESYFIMDFLVEDIENDPESVEYRGVFGFYRKKKDSPRPGETSDKENGAKGN